MANENFMDTQTGGTGETTQSQPANLEQSSVPDTQLNPPTDPPKQRPLTEAEAAAEEAASPQLSPQELLSVDEGTTDLKDEGETLTEEVGRTAEFMKEDFTNPYTEPISSLFEPDISILYPEEEGVGVESDFETFEEEGVGVESYISVDEPEIPENRKNYKQPVKDYLSEVDKLNEKKEQEIEEMKSVFSDEKPKGDPYAEVMENIDFSFKEDGVETERITEDYKHGISKNMDTFMEITGSSMETIDSFVKDSVSDDDQFKLSGYAKSSKDLSQAQDDLAELTRMQSSGEYDKSKVSGMFSTQIARETSEMGAWGRSETKDKIEQGDLNSLIKEKENQIASIEKDRESIFESIDESAPSLKEERNVNETMFKKFENKVNSNLKTAWGTKWEKVGKDGFDHDVYQDPTDIGIGVLGEPTGLYTASEAQERKALYKWLDTEGRDLIKEDIKNGTHKFSERAEELGHDTRTSLIHDIYEIEQHNYRNENPKLDFYTYSGFQYEAKKINRENSEALSGSIKERATEVFDKYSKLDSDWVEKNKPAVENKINTVKTEMDKIFQSQLANAVATNNEAQAIMNKYRAMSFEGDISDAEINKQMFGELKSIPEIGRMFSVYENKLSSAVNKISSGYERAYGEFKGELYRDAQADMKTLIVKDVKKIYRGGINNDLNSYNMADNVTRIGDFKNGDYWHKRKLISMGWELEKQHITEYLEDDERWYPANDSERGKHFTHWTGRRPKTQEEIEQDKKEKAERTGRSAQHRYMFYAIDDLLQTPRGSHPSVYAVQAFAHEQLKLLEQKKKDLNIDYSAHFAENLGYSSTEDMKKMSQTEMYLKKILNTDESDEAAWKEFFDGFAGNLEIPFIHSFLGIQENTTLSGATERYANGNMDTYDIGLVEAYGALNKINQLAPNSFWYGVGAGLSTTTTFMVEMAMTGGLNTVGFKTGEAIVAGLAKRKTDDAVIGAVSNMAKDPAWLRTVQKTTGMLMGGVYQGTLNPQWAETMSERMMDEVSIINAGGYDGLVAAVDQNSGEEAWTAFWKSYSSYVAMNVVERMGGNIGSPKMKKEIAETIGNQEFLRKTLVGRYFRSRGYQTVTEGAEAMAKEGVLWSNILSEFGEELLQGEIDALITGDRELFGMTSEEFWTTAAVTALFGGAMHVGKKVKQSMRSDGTAMIEVADEDGNRASVNIPKETWGEFNKFLSDKNLSWKAALQFFEGKEGQLTAEQELALTQVFLNVRGKEITNDPDYKDWVDGSDKGSALQDEVEAAEEEREEAAPDIDQKKTEEEVTPEDKERPEQVISKSTFSQQEQAEEIDEETQGLREAYKEAFGRYPSSRMKNENIQKKLDGLKEKKEPKGLRKKAKEVNEAIEQSEISMQEIDEDGNVSDVDTDQMKIEFEVKAQERANAKAAKQEAKKKKEAEAKAEETEAKPSELEEKGITFELGQQEEAAVEEEVKPEVKEEEVKPEVKEEVRVVKEGVTGEQLKKQKAKTKEKPKVDLFAEEDVKEEKPKKKAPKKKAEKKPTKIETGKEITLQSTAGGNYKVLQKENGSYEVTDPTGRTTETLKPKKDDGGRPYVVAKGGNTIYLDQLEKQKKEVKKEDKGEELYSRGGKTVTTTDLEAMEQGGTSVNKTNVAKQFGVTPATAESIIEDYKRGKGETITKKAAKEGDTVILEPMSASRGPREMVFSEGQWKLKKGDKLRSVPALQQEAQDVFEGTKEAYVPVAERKKVEVSQEELAEMYGEDVAEALGEDMADIHDIMESEAPQQKKRSKSKRMATKRRGESTRFINMLADRLKIFPNIKITDTVEEFEAAAAEFGRSKNEAAIYDRENGVVHLNPKVANSNTAFEEYAHVWLDIATNKSSQMVKRMKALVKQNGQEYIDEVMNDSGYADIHENEDAVLEEALAKMIADRAEAIMEVKRKAPLKTALKEFWNTIYNALIRFRSTKKFDISKDTLEDAVNKVAKELNRGKPVSMLTSEELAEFTVTGKSNFTIEPSSMITPRKDASGYKAATYFRLWFSPSKGVGTEAAQEIESMKNKKISAEQHGRRLADRLKSAMSEYAKAKKLKGALGIKGKNQEEYREFVSKVDESLRDPQMRAEWFASDPLAKQLIQPIVEEMRNMIDTYQQELIKSGLLPEELQMTLDGNMDMYVHTSYHIFSPEARDVEDWLGTFSPQDQKEIINWMYDGAYSGATKMTFNQKDGKYRVAFENSFGVNTDEALEFETKEALKEYLSGLKYKNINGSFKVKRSLNLDEASGEIVFGSPIDIASAGVTFKQQEDLIKERINSLARGPVEDLIAMVKSPSFTRGKAELSAMKKKKNLDPTYEKLLRKIEDPLSNFMKTIAKQTGYLYKGQVEQGLIDSGLISQNKGGENNIPITIGTKTMYTNADVYNYMKGRGGRTPFQVSRAVSKGPAPSSAPATIMNSISGMSMLYKAGVTVLSRGSNAANYISGYTQLIKTGHTPMYMVSAMRTLEQGLQKGGVDLASREERASLYFNTVPTLIRFMTEEFSSSKLKKGSALTDTQKSLYGVNSWEELTETQMAEAFLDELNDAGIVNQSINAEVIRDLAEDAFKSKKLGQKQAFETVAENWFNNLRKDARRRVNNLMESAASAYSFSDSMFKAIMYMHEKTEFIDTYGSVMKKNGSSDEDVETEMRRMAGEAVRKQMPTYDRSPEFLKWWSRFPLLGSFIQFDFQSKVNDKNILASSLKMFADAHKFKKQGHNKEASKLMIMGTKKMGGLMFSLSLSALMYRLFAKILFDWSDEEDAAFRAMQPEYRKHNTLLHLDNDKTTDHWFIDYNRLDPQSMYSRYYAAFTEEGAGAGMMSILEPYISEDIFFGPATEALYNMDEEGNPISVSNTAMGQTIDRIFHAVNPVTYSGEIGQINRVIEAFNDDNEDVEEVRKKSVLNEMSNTLFGIKMRTHNVNNQAINTLVYDKLREIQPKPGGIGVNSQLKKTISNFERGDATKADIEREHALAEAIANEQLDEARRIIQGMRTLGFTEQQVRDVVNSRTKSGRRRINRTVASALLNEDKKLSYNKKTGAMITIKKPKVEDNPFINIDVGGGLKKSLSIDVGL